MTQAIANTKFNVEGWAIRKEIHDGQPLIVLYAEVAGVNDPARVGLRLHQELKKVDLFYDDLDSMMNIQPIRVEMLNPGTFSEYSSRKQDSGAELSQLKPPKMNASDAIINELLRISETINTKSISV